MGTTTSYVIFSGYPNGDKTLLDSLWRLLDRVPGAPNRKRPDAVTGILDDNNRAAKQIGARLCQNSIQALNHALATRVMQPEENDAYNLPCRRRDYFTEIQVKRENDALLSIPFLKDLGSRDSPSSRR
jgi:hypothetical protein